MFQRSKNSNQNHTERGDTRESGMKTKSKKLRLSLRNTKKEKSNQLLKEEIREEREETIEENIIEKNEQKYLKKRKSRDLPLRNSELSKKKRRET
jgi:hypothetical protein